MSEGCLLWHSRHCGRDTTGVLYKGPLTPSTKRAARLIRQAGPYFRSAQCPLVSALTSRSPRTAIGPGPDGVRECASRRPPCVLTAPTSKSMRAVLHARQGTLRSTGSGRTIRPWESRESPGVSPSARFLIHGNVAANQWSRAVPGLVGRGLAEAAKSGSWNLFWCGNRGGGRGTGQSLPSTQRAPLAAPAPLRGCRDFSVRFRHLGLGFGKRTVAQDSLKTANTCFKSRSCRCVAPSSPGSGDFLPKPGFL
jgi:hypothetical protein